jgi:hypothetical protein
MFIIEDYPLENPNQHQSTDTLNTLNLEFHYEATRALVAAVAHIAGTDAQTTTTTTETTITTTTNYTTTTVPGGPCPAKTIMGQETPELKKLRTLRNEVFTKSAAGNYYTALYYKHASELSDIFARDAALKGKAYMLIQSLMPDVKRILAKRAAATGSDTVRKSIELIDGLQKQASPALVEELTRLKRDIQNGLILKTVKETIQ